MKKFYSIIPLLVLGIATIASAATIRGGEQVILSETSEDDAYLFGATVSLEEKVQGDLVTAGGTIEIDGTVTQDITAAAGQIDISGYVGDDIRIAGGDVRLSGAVDDDVFIAAGRVEIEDDAIIRGNVHIVAGEIVVTGVIEGDATIRGDRVALRRVIRGDLDAQATELLLDSVVIGSSKLSAKRMGFRDNAGFSGDIDYWHGKGVIDFEPYKDEDVRVRFNDELSIKDINTHQTKAALFVGGVGAFMLSILFALAFIILVVSVSKNSLKEMGKKLQKSFWKNAFYGFLYFTAVPVFVVILMITVVGIPFSVFIGVMYGFSIFFAKPLTALIFAQWYATRTKKSWKPWQLILWAMLFYIVLKIGAYIPILGWIAVFILVCAAYGALIVTKWQMIQKAR